MNQKIKTSNTRSGSGLIFAVVLLFVILGMVVTLSSVTMLETKMNQKTKSSVGAFYNADSGVEWALNKIASNSSVAITAAFPDFSVNKTPCPSGFNCDIYFLDKDGKVITTNLTVDQIKAVRAVGTQNTEETTQRAIEAAVASGGGGCYVQHLLDRDIGTGKRCPVNTSDGCCASGFSNKAYLGAEGTCKYGNDDTRMTAYVPPAGYDSINSICSEASSELQAIYFAGKAYVCCL